jgi:hypothetical protein
VDIIILRGMIMGTNKFHLLDIFMSVETPRISKLRNILILGTINVHA